MLVVEWKVKTYGEFEAKPHRKNDEKQKQILLFYSYVSLFSLSDWCDQCNFWLILLLLCFPIVSEAISKCIVCSLKNTHKDHQKLCNNHWGIQLEF